MKRLSIVLAMMVMLAMLPFSGTTVFAATANISLDRTVYEANDTITVTYSGTDQKDWTGLYPAGLLPGSGQNSIDWTYTVGSGQATFSVANLNGAGDYVAFLCDNDGYTILDRVCFTVLDSDVTDYGVTSATVQASVTAGKTALSVTVTPSSASALTYRLYWAKNGVRLEDYLPIKELTHSGGAPFVMTCNDCLFMPDEANGIEVAVAEGHSSSYFVAAPNTLKAPASTYRYSFQVLTDLHASSDLPAHIPNLKAALADVATLCPNSTAIFTVGDNTDRGTQAQYDLLLRTLDSLTFTLPPIYYSIGNHDEVYGGTYAEEIERFLSNLGMPGLYYSVELNGTKFLVLASQEQTTAGALSDAQLAWVKAELAATNPDMPVFLFLHQPLKDTVSGTLTRTGSAHQRWYLGEPSGENLHNILRQYPNALLFSGHTHSSFEQEQPFLYGNGMDASFMNAASTAYLWNDNNEDFAGSQGLYVEVYEDYILIKGRDFTRAKWCSTAQFLVPVHSADADAYEGDLIGNAEDWAYDSTVMQVTSDAYSTAFCNTNGAWPKADRVLESPITLDPDHTSLYVDMVLENDASANIYLITKNGAAVSLSPYIPKLATADGTQDMVGNGKRVRGVINMRDVAFEQSSLNDNGTVTLTQVRIYASGNANTNMRVYDLSLVNDRSPKAVSLMNPDTLAVSDRAKSGGYVYDNGTLTVTSSSAEGYTVSFALDETYNVSVLRNWLVKAQATTAFDVTIQATTSSADAKFGLAADFWPSFCDAKENGYIPAGSYEKAVDFYSAYTYNGFAPANGMSTVKTVTVTLNGEGHVVLNGLQLSSASTIRNTADGMYREDTTPDAMGDINGDGITSTTDIRYILKATVGAKDLSDAQRAIADVNGDGEMTTLDARELLMSVLG